MPALRLVLALGMIAAGMFHLAWPAPFVAMVPSWLPAPLALVLVSGVCEIAGGVGLLVPPLRRAAGIGLTLLYIAVFPANLNMALHDIQPLPSRPPPAPWILWARLPLQLVLIAWALRVSRPPRARERPSA